MSRERNTNRQSRQKGPKRHIISFPLVVVVVVVVVAAAAARGVCAERGSLCLGQAASLFGGDPYGALADAERAVAAAPTWAKARGTRPAFQEREIKKKEKKRK